MSRWNNRSVVPLVPGTTACPALAGRFTSGVPIWILRTPTGDVVFARHADAARALEALADPDACLLTSANYGCKEEIVA